MRNRNGLVTTSSLMVTSQIGCGGQVAFDSGTGGSSSSSLIQATGGTSSNGIVGTTGGGGSTGGSSLPDTFYCNGLPRSVSKCRKGLPRSKRQAPHETGRM
jgi:hypothetical protein